MSITFALVDSTPYRLRYLATSSGEVPGTANIPNDGGVTPDLLTDLSTAPSGPIRKLVRARLDGIGIIAAGTVLSQAQCRAILLSDNAATLIGNNNVPRGVTTAFARTGSATWAVDATADGQGDPVIVVAASVVVGTAYIDLTCRHTFNL